MKKIFAFVTVVALCLFFAVASSAKASQSLSADTSVSGQATIYVATTSAISNGSITNTCSRNDVVVSVATYSLPKISGKEIPLPSVTVTGLTTGDHCVAVLNRGGNTVASTDYTVT
jgi:hypothetical protein